MPSTTIDPVTTQVVGNLLGTIADEVEVAMIRTAYSPVIKESFDCSAGILNLAGEYWAQADAIPLQVGALRAVQIESLARIPLDRLAPGDVLITNDPSTGAPHLNDFVALAPVFCDDRPIAFVATLMHHTDVGGKAPGSMPADATELFQEGIRFPVRRLIADGVRDEAFVELLLANTRTPKNLERDLEAQISAVRLGSRRIEEAARRFGVERLIAAAEEYVGYGEQLARRRIAALLTPGVYEAERAVESPAPATEAATPVARIAARVEVGHDGVHVDFTGSSEQVALPINCVLSNSVAVCMIALRCMLGAGIPSNGGLNRVLDVTTRQGTIMDPVLPAPVGARAMAAALAFETVMECLGHAAPDRAVASSSGGTTMPYTWMPAGGERTILVDNSLTGGAGARATADGLSAVDNSVTNGMNLPAEVLEQEHPVVVERHELRRGSGGDGRFRGGLGLRRVVQFLAAGTLSVRGYRHRSGPPGLFGGGAGATTAFWIERDGERIPLAPQSSGVPTEAGDRFVAETAGGGGIG